MKSQITFECCGAVFTSYEAIKAHLETAHGIDLSTQKFSRKMVSHLDAQSYYSSVYAFSCDKVSFTKIAIVEREPDDPMRFG